MSFKTLLVNLEQKKKFEPGGRHSGSNHVTRTASVGR